MKVGTALSLAGVVAVALMAIALAQQFSILLGTLLALVVTALAIVGFISLWISRPLGMAKALEREAPDGLVLIVRPALDFDAGLRRLGMLGDGEEWGRGSFALVVAKGGMLEFHKPGSTNPIALAANVIEAVSPRAPSYGARANDLRVAVDADGVRVPLDIVVCNRRFPAVDVQDERALRETASALVKSLAGTQ